MKLGVGALIAGVALVGLFWKFPEVTKNEGKHSFLSRELSEAIKAACSSKLGQKFIGYVDQHNYPDLYAHVNRFPSCLLKSIMENFEKNQLKNPDEYRNFLNMTAVEMIHYLHDVKLRYVKDTESIRTSDFQEPASSSKLIIT
ncbi:MAG: hypothetical protein ACHQJ6_08600 [Candidatus Berkiellales bacterium]